MQQIHRNRIVLTTITLLSTGLVLFTGTEVAYGQTQGEMNRTAGMEYKKVDAAMNAAYKKLMAVLDTGKKARLRKAQAAWLKFRDTEAAFRASKVQGGSVYPTVLATHLTSLTQERTQALKDAYHLFTTDGEM